MFQNLPAAMRDWHNKLEGPQRQDMPAAEKTAVRSFATHWGTKRKLLEAAIAHDQALLYGRLSVALQKHLLWVGDVERKKKAAQDQVDTFALGPVPGSLEKRVLDKIVTGPTGVHSYFDIDLRAERARRPDCQIRTLDEIRHVVLIRPLA